MHNPITLWVPQPMNISLFLLLSVTVYLYQIKDFEFLPFVNFESFKLTFHSLIFYLTYIIFFIFVNIDLLWLFCLCHQQSWAFHMVMCVSI